MVEHGRFGGNLLRRGSFTSAGHIGLGQRGVGTGATGAAGQRDADVSTENLVLARSFAGNLQAYGGVGQAVAAAAAGDDLGAFGVAASEVEFVAVF